MEAKKKTLKQRPYRKLGIILIIIGIILGIVGIFLLPTDPDSLAAASIAWIPGALALLAGIFFVTWDGTGSSDSGMSGPL